MRRPLKKPLAKGGQLRTGQGECSLRKRLNCQWMRGVKGCFVYGKNHRKNSRHSRKEVTEAVNRLKRRHLQATLSVEDLADVLDMVLSSEDDKDDAGEKLK